MARWNERQAVALLKARLAEGAAPRLPSGSEAPSVELGIGDDAALLRCGSERLVVSVDAAVEGVHFRRDWLSLSDVGYRSFQAAISDLAAMGARPLAALSALILPRGLSEAELAAIAEGQAAASQACSCPLVGGNLARGGRLSLTTTVVGRLASAAVAPLRSGARPGQSLWLVGRVGEAAAGLAWLQRSAPGTSPGTAPPAAAADCVARWRRPRAQLAAGLALPGWATAAIDLSDGLWTDSLRLAEASAVGLVIELAALRAALSPALLAMARRLRRSPLRFALAGGEDYALLAAASRPAPAIGARRIGYVRAGRGVVVQGPYGYARAGLQGFDHLA